jgi:transposase, IS5 family
MNSAQMALVSALLGERLGQNSRLERLDTVVDWSLFANILEEALNRKKTGRPAYPALAMLKALLLQQWYGLSDPGLEEALLDRLSFRKFCGFDLSDPTPDETTLCRFRGLLSETGLGERLFQELNRQLEQQGLMVKSGTLVDATLVQAQAAKPPYEKGKAAGSSVDTDANWTRKNGKAHFGYRAHVGVDAGSQLIRQAVLTPASVNESVVADALISGDEKAVYGDKGYESKARRKRLKRLGIKDRILHRSHKNQAGLPYWQQVRNRLIAKPRAAVERVFAILKRHYGYVRVRYTSLKRNQTQFYLLCLGMNLRRASTLLG